MKTKNLLMFSLLILIIGLGSYMVFNQQKNNDTTKTTTTTTTKLALCSNKYYETQYDKDGKIIIKNFPYYKIGDKEECKSNETMKTEE